MNTSHYFILNLFLALIWVVLNGDGSSAQLFFGFFLGFIILWLFQFAFHSSEYIKQVKGFFKFVFIFAWLFIESNLNVAKIILFIPKRKISSSFIFYSITGLSKLEILLLSQFITLTPGSISVELQPNLLWIHLLDVKDKESAIRNLDELKNLILGFTR